LRVNTHCGAQGPNPVPGGNGDWPAPTNAALRVLHDEMALFGKKRRFGAAPWGSKNETKVL